MQGFDLGVVFCENGLQGGEGGVVKLEGAEALDVEEDVEARVWVLRRCSHPALPSGGGSISISSSISNNIISSSSSSSITTTSTASTKVAGSPRWYR